MELQWLAQECRASCFRAASWAASQHEGRLNGPTERRLAGDTLASFPISHAKGPNRPLGQPVTAGTNQWPVGLAERDSQSSLPHLMDVGAKRRKSLVWALQAAELEAEEARQASSALSRPPNRSGRVVALARPPITRDRWRG